MSVGVGLHRSEVAGRSNAGDTVADSGATRPSAPPPPTADLIFYPAFHSFRDRIGLQVLRGVSGGDSMLPGAGGWSVSPASGTR